MMNPEQLQEYIDACRPNSDGSGSDDLERPEMESLRQLLQSDAEVRRQWEAAQAWDRHMQQLCHEVPVPAGLEARVLQRLASAAGANGRSDAGPPSDAANEVASEAATMAEPQLQPGGRTPSRRWWIAALLATAASLALVARFTLWPSPVANDRLAEDAVQWSTDDLDPNKWSNDWQLLGEQADLRPMAQQVEAVHRAWQHVAVELDQDCIAYRLGDLRFSQAPVLFVLRTRTPLASPATRPPAQPNQRTGGVACGVWREGDCLYALVVPGAESGRYYQQLTRQTHASHDRIAPHAVLLGHVR